MLIKFEELINDKSKNENHIQKYMEDNTELIPLPFMLNHGLHFNTIISKFPISTSYISDFAYITKSTVGWQIVFIEIENHNKKIFRKDAKDVKFTSEFNNAYDQVLSWKSYIKDHASEVKKSLQLLLRPSHMYSNQVDFKFVLVLGKNSELLNQNMINMFKNKQSDDINIMTYDSIVNYYKQNRNAKKHVLLAKDKERFKIKFLDSIKTDLLTHLNYTELVLNDNQVREFRENDFEIDQWLKGEYLVVNNKYAKSSMDRLMQEMKDKIQKNIT